MNDISLFRIYLLRAMYLLIVVGLGIVIMPGFILHEKPWEPMEGVVQCMLAAFWFLSIVGFRYPLQMLPILLWELVWKSIWLIAIALPLWSSGHMDKLTSALVPSILFVIIIPLVIPWKYVLKHYVQKDSERWR